MVSAEVVLLLIIIFLIFVIFIWYFFFQNSNCVVVCKNEKFKPTICKYEKFQSPRNSWMNIDLIDDCNQIQSCIDDKTKIVQNSVDQCNVSLINVGAELNNLQQQEILFDNEICDSIQQANNKFNLEKDALFKLRDDLISCLDNDDEKAKILDRTNKLINRLNKINSYKFSINGVDTNINLKCQDNFQNLMSDKFNLTSSDFSNISGNPDTGVISSSTNRIGTTNKLPAPSKDITLSVIAPYQLFTYQFVNGNFQKNQSGWASSYKIDKNKEFQVFFSKINGDNIQPSEWVSIKPYFTARYA